MRLVALDLETTGLNPQENQILQAGMVCFESETGEIVGEFETLVSHARYSGDPFALSLNANLLKRLAAGESSRRLHKHRNFKAQGGEARVQESLFHAMREVLTGWGLSKPHAVGFNVAPFDIAFLKAVGIDLFHHRAIECGSLLQKTFAEYCPISSKDFTAREGGEVAHTALADCHMARRAYGHALGLRWDA